MTYITYSQVQQLPALGDVESKYHTLADESI